MLLLIKNRFCTFDTVLNLNAISNKTILISPLDWGFGHTTRCVSIIQKLIQQNNTLIFAGNDLQCQFIKTEFTALKTEFIDGYNIHLSSKKSTYWQLATQSSKILKTIKSEHNWVKQYINSNQIDFIISDNRYGFRHPKVKSIFIGHQINLQLPYLKKAVNHKLIQLINKFNFCWIMDDPKINLAGQLSNPKSLKIPFEYIGLQSRFTKQNLPIRYDYLVIISGPSPENSIFLNQIETHFKTLKCKIAIVSTVKSQQNIDNFDYYNNPTTYLLNQLLNASKTIISRAGYTTLMELYALHKNAILIPTKGQYEQEYLAKHLQVDGFTFIDKVEDIPSLMRTIAP